LLVAFFSKTFAAGEVTSCSQASIETFLNCSAGKNVVDSGRSVADVMLLSSIDLWVCEAMLDADWLLPAHTLASRRGPCVAAGPFYVNGTFFAKAFSPVVCC